MFSLFKKRFASDENDSVFVDYNQETISSYKEKYPNVDIYEVPLPEIKGVAWFSIKRWYKKDSDQIKKNEPICELENNKFTLELESYLDGYLYFRQRPNTQLKAGDIVCVILQKRID